jgi:hypothetical protein
VRNYGKKPKVRDENLSLEGIVSKRFAMNSRRLIQSMALETIAPLSDDTAWNNAGGTHAVVL